MNRLARLVVLAVVIIVGVRWGVPWLEKTFGGAKDRVAHKSGDNSCVRSAQEASETWGGGLKNFVNPPYDLGAWGSFRADVEAKISTAESSCTCADESCTKVRDAMRDLRGLVLDLDGAIRGSGSMPGDVVQRQESIDNRINEADDLVRSGK
jgi:hypothetical protein